MKKINNQIITCKTIDGNKKYGILVDEKIVCEPSFDDIKPFSNGLSAVKKGEKWGFINESGELAIDFEYYDVKEFEDNGLCIVQTGEKPGSWGLLKDTGDIVEFTSKLELKFECDKYGCYRIEPFNGKDVTIAKFWGMFVLLNNKGEIISEEFRTLEFVEKSNVFIGRHIDKWIVIDKNQDLLFEPKVSYDDIYYPNTRYKTILVEYKNKYGLLDFEGNEIVPIEYDTLYDVSDEGLCCALFPNGKYGYIDTNNNVVIPPISDVNGYFAVGMAPITTEDDAYYIDINGNVCFGKHFKEVGNFYEAGYAIVKTKDGINAVIDRNGEIQFTFSDNEFIEEFYCKDITVYQDESSIGLIDGRGNKYPVVNASEIFLSSECDFHLFRTKDNMYNYIDSKGEILFDEDFYRANEPNADGDIVVCTQEEYKNKGLIHPDFGYLEPSSSISKFDPVSGLAIDGSSMIVNKDLEYVNKYDYDYISPFSKGYTVAIKKLKPELYDVNGNHMDFRENLNVRNGFVEFEQ